MHKNLRVLLVRNANSYDFGGGERYPVNLSVELRASEIEALIGTSHQKISELAKDNGVKVVHTPWLKHQNFTGKFQLLIPLYLLWQLYLIFRYVLIINRHGVDVLHLQGRDDFIAGTLAGRLFRKKIIWTDHADLKYIYANTSRPLRNPVGKIVRYVSKYAHTIICVSHNELKLISESLNSKTPGNFKVIYNGAKDTPISHTQNEVDHKFTFVATSRLVRTKGIFELIDATNRLEDEGHKIKTLLLGEGPDEQQARDAAGKSVVFGGFPKDYLADVASCDVFIHPSYNEGFSISIVEAAMLGMPVITTNIGGNPEIVINNETGILIEPQNTQAIYDAMLYAINHKSKMEEYGSQLRKKYLKEFRFDRIVRDQIVPLYNV